MKQMCSSCNHQNVLYMERLNKFKDLQRGIPHASPPSSESLVSASYMESRPIAASFKNFISRAHICFWLICVRDQTCALSCICPLLHMCAYSFLKLSTLHTDGKITILTGSTSYTLIAVLKAQTPFHTTYSITQFVKNSYYTDLFTITLSYLLWKAERCPRFWYWISFWNFRCFRLSSFKAIISYIFLCEIKIIHLGCLGPSLMQDSWLSVFVLYTVTRSVIVLSSVSKLLTSPIYTIIASH